MHHTKKLMKIYVTAFVAFMLSAASFIQKVSICQQSPLRDKNFCFLNSVDQIFRAIGAVITISLSIQNVDEISLRSEERCCLLSR